MGDNVSGVPDASGTTQSYPLDEHVRFEFLSLVLYTASEETIQSNQPPPSSTNC